MYFFEGEEFFNDPPTPIPPFVKPVPGLPLQSKEEDLASIFESIIFAENRQGFLPDDIAQAVAVFAKRRGFSATVSYVSNDISKVSL